MFEEVISYVLTKFLGDYVSGINKEALNLSIWGGDVQLKNLVLFQFSFFIIFSQSSLMH